MSVNIVSKEKVEIQPQNAPSTLNSAFSFRAGNPIINIVIPSQAKYLESSSLRINGTLTIKGGAAGLRPNNLTSKVAVAQNRIRIASRAGISTAFQNVVLTAANTNQSLESIRQYGRLATSILSSTHSQQDMMSEKSCTAVMNGLDASTSLLVNNDVRFSVPLYSGMLMGSSLIPLSAIGGLGIQIELAADNQFLHGADAALQGGAFYELSDVSLSCNLAVPDAQGVAELSNVGSGQISYNSFSSLYQVINASDFTATMNLSNSRVLSVAHNFIPVSHSNNYAHDSFTTGELKNAVGGVYNADVVLKRVSFARGGVRLGLEYEMDCETQSSERIPEAQVLQEYLASYGTMGRMLNGRLLLGYGGNPLRPDRPDHAVDQTSTTFNGKRSVGVLADARRNFGVGLNLDKVSDVGMNFRDSAYSVRIVSTLNGNSPNAMHTHLLSKNVLTYSPQGIMIST